MQKKVEVIAKSKDGKLKIKSLSQEA